MLDDRILEAFMNGFYGYGNYDAQYWFIGKEEGGGRELVEVEIRLKKWELRGRKKIEDLAEYHREIEIPEHFNDAPKKQRTWDGIIRVFLSAQNRTVNDDSVLEYQKSVLGRKAGETCLLELFPLPSPNTTTWRYCQWSNLPSLRTRSSYNKYLKDSRVTFLREKIALYKPKAVIFYSSDRRYKDYWGEIAGVEFHSTELKNVSCGRNGQTFFVITEHPAYTSRRLNSSTLEINKYFYQVGNLLAEKKLDG